MKTFNYEKIIRNSHAWFNDASKAWMWDGPRTDLEVLLQNRVVSEFGKAITRIGQLAAWHARRGCVLLGERNADGGWQEMKRSFDYRMWQLRIAVERVRIAGLGSSSADSTRNPFHLLGMAIGFQDWETVRWLGDIIIESRDGNLLGYWTSARQEYFPHYLCELYARSVGNGEFPDDFGPYAGIFTDWSDPARLGGAIRTICDYHVQQIKANGEFEHNPHDIFPSDILALYRIRERLRLETPLVKHPLLETPFSQTPDSIAYEPDPVVVQAMEKVGQLLPDVVAKKVR